ncbi:uncharacterized protein LTR77_007264 [Saxophila tyrrhenica]|uniref:PIG-P domain-containing protein n=1 Tax=Saxophila tyrrhenica TaxID=1690608 RepID=A0AAV9P4X1_9PEZI|nr:hypothetical protein LTR77_007264 [Saxophila tyrrhenica]
MPPQSRGPDQQVPQLKPAPSPAGFQSKSTPNLPTLRAFHKSKATNEDGTATTLHDGPASPEIVTSPSESASIDDFSLDADAPRSLADSDSESSSSTSIHAASLPPTRPLSLRQRSYGHHSLAPQAFAPPFYGRPPTPLPPSPSLTSLLRPTFSSNYNSRPTTPDPSSDEGGTSTPATHSHQPSTATGSQTPSSSLTNTFRTATKPIPRASPKVPTYEYYGFTLYLTSSLVFIVYLLWSFLPSPFLHQLGIYYYPNRWWALAIPAWTVMFGLYIYVALASYNTGYLTVPMHAVESLVDEAAHVAVVDGKGQLVFQEKKSWQKEGGKKDGGKGTRKKGGRSRQGSLNMEHSAVDTSQLDWRTLWNEGTDAVMDIPIGGVCEILYGQHDDSDDEDHDVKGNAHDR